jgi:hypothetical protein
VEKLVGDPAKYAELCRSSRREFRLRLNWDVSARRVLDSLGSLVEKAKTSNVRVPVKAGASKQPALAAS